MKATEKLLRALGAIEGERIGIRKLSERVATLEAWQWWLSIHVQIHIERVPLLVGHNLWINIAIMHQ